VLQPPIEPAQYTSLDYGKLARANGVVLSVGMAGECWDNAVAESFFATIKRELIDTRAWPTRAGLRVAVFDYIEGWYNTRRLSHGVRGLWRGVA
jgi:putative transposase